MATKMIRLIFKEPIQINSDDKLEICWDADGQQRALLNGVEVPSDREIVVPNDSQ